MECVGSVIILFNKKLKNMKKYISIISILILFVTLSCTKEGMDFDTNGGKGKLFVHFVGSAQEIVTRSDQANTLEIIVSANSLSDAARTYNLNIESSSTAIEGEHYVLSSKTVTIPANQYSGKVTLTANNDNLTPEEVVVKLEIDSEDVIDYGSKQTIYLSCFFEVTIDWLLGDWTVTDYDAGEDAGSYPVTITKIDDNTVGIYNFWDWGETIKATINAENSTIIIEPDAFIYNHPTYGVAKLIPVIDGSPSKTEGLIGDCKFAGITLRRYAVYVDAGYFVTNGTSVFSR